MSGPGACGADCVALYNALADSHAALAADHASQRSRAEAAEVEVARLRAVLRDVRGVVPATWQAYIDREALGDGALQKCWGAND